MQTKQNSEIGTDSVAPLQGEKYWMSLEQFQGDASLARRAEDEFLSSPLGQSEDQFARRDFLKLMGASFALATTGCVRRPQGTIIPYAKAPLEITPGVPNYYTSSWFDGSEGGGLLVKTMEGRPIKVEGLAAHPVNRGGLSARAHAEVLSLYDPDRLKAPVRNLLNKDRTNKETVSAEIDAADEKIVAALKQGSAVLLTATLPSPSLKAIVADFAKAYGAKWVQFDSLPLESIRVAQKMSYGKPVLPRYRFDRAKLVVSIDADFLGTFISPVEFTKQWSKARRPGDGMARLVSFESILSLTGMNADDRHRIKPSQQLDIVLALIARVAAASKGAMAIPTGVAKAVAQASERLSSAGFDLQVLNKVAAELSATRGESLVLAGGLPTLTDRAVDLQVAVNALNSMLGNDGKTIDHDVSPCESYGGSTESLAALIADMNAGKVKTLIIDAFNPIYVLPKDSGFQEAIRKVETVVYLGNRNDETGAASEWVLPAGTQFEAWGDLEIQSGVFSIQQPTIMPLYKTRSLGELLIDWCAMADTEPANVKAVESWMEYVQFVWRTQVQPKAEAGRGKSFADFWLSVLQEGIVTTVSRERTSSARAFVGSIAPANSEQQLAESSFELVLYPTVQLMDGRLGNIAWLHELPDPVSKVVWDNYLAMSPKAARTMGVVKGDIVEITVSGQSLKAPVLVQPGLHDEVVAVAVGYGQKKSSGGRVAAGVGFDGYEIARFNGGKPVYSGLPVTSMKKLNAKYDLVSTQDHHVMEGRQIVIETTKADFVKDPGAGIHKHQVFSIWPEHRYTKHKWALTVDLNSCTGCSACVVACQSENNVPVVGKKYVMQGREMHWIRIDRYYKGDPDSPEAVVMPLMCQHCENAPCETVCPVLATVHNDEGLNDMVYNRCVGTRYCSNNCPYKVRRFNWFNYVKTREAPLNMAYNPDVTVRVRGVMEKCTFCVQRIRSGVAQAKRDKRELKDGDIKTACQQSCPADAIVFGDLNDQTSEVSRIFKEKRSYKLLEELNAVPRVAYQTRVRNAVRESKPHKGHHGDHASVHAGADHQVGGV